MSIINLYFMALIYFEIKSLREDVKNGKSTKIKKGQDGEAVETVLHEGPAVGEPQ